MFQATPRTLAAAGEQKNTASSPSSSGVVNCIEGSFSPSSSFLASSLLMPCCSALASTCFCTSGVSTRSEEHTSELQSQSNLVCRLLLEKKKKKAKRMNAVDHNREA